MLGCCSETAAEQCALEAIQIASRAAAAPVRWLAAALQVTGLPSVLLLVPPHLVDVWDLPLCIILGELLRRTGLALHLKLWQMGVCCQKKGPKQGALIDQKQEEIVVLNLGKELARAIIGIAELWCIERTMNSWPDKGHSSYPFPGPSCLSGRGLSSSLQ